MRARWRIDLGAAWLLAGLFGGNAIAAPNPPAVPPIEWPGGARADLALPDSLWQRCRETLQCGDRPVGYTAEEMAQFGRDALVLRTVSNLFRDVRAIQRWSGKMAEDLIANAGNPAELVQRAFAFTDVSAGRMLSMPDSASWGVDWIPPEASPAAVPSAAFDALLAHEHRGSKGQISESERRAWAKLPEPAQRLAVRVLIGAYEASPWIAAAYEDPVFASLASNASKAMPESTRVMDCYHFATAPWVDVRMDQSATLSRASFEALTRLDRSYLAFGSVLFLTHLTQALAEYRTAELAKLSSPDVEAPPVFPGCRFMTPLGPVVISGTGTDTITETAFLVLDLGGDDRYSGRQGVPIFPQRPISVVVDLGGNDIYEGGPRPVSLACGLFGLGTIVDRAGNDQYRSSEAGLGAGYFGVGLLQDEAGNDAYMLDTHDGQGAALAGVGLLVDRSGDDMYTCGFSAQAFGATLGAGVLVDVKGDDQYLARDDGNRSALYLDQSVSMAQGVGQGRRADLGDGHSLAGGIGFLADGAGNDTYHASAWSQGAGYWWAAGFLEDLGGNDHYRNGKYSLGAAAHFAIGCQVDLTGNDAYNIGNDTAVNQYQGHARDGSIGISTDGDGDDQYYFRSHCGGSGDLNSIGLFWDRRGADRYQVRYEPTAPFGGWTDTPPMGTATSYVPFRSFRDDVGAFGIFLDTGGEDEYAWEESAAADSLRRVLSLARPGNGQRWVTRRAAVSGGVGWDLDGYRGKAE